jgi:hypothetical protein
MYFIDKSFILLYSRVYKLTDEQDVLHVGLLKKDALYGGQRTR